MKTSIKIILESNDPDCACENMYCFQPKNEGKYMLHGPDDKHIGFIYCPDCRSMSLVLVPSPEMNTIKFPSMKAVGAAD